jgi:hypothetical protein
MVVPTKLAIATWRIDALLETEVFKANNPPGPKARTRRSYNIASRPQFYYTYRPVGRFPVDRSLGPEPKADKRSG